MKLDRVTAETWEFMVDHPEKTPQGILLWYKGVPYPRRFYFDRLNDSNHTLRALNALGTVKKFLFALIYLKSVVIPYRFKIKKYEPFLETLFGLVNWNLAEFWIKDEEFSVPVWEIGKFIHRFLWEIGFSTELAAKYTRLVMMILEFDNAYRYRVQDIFGIVHWIDRKTLKYALKVYQTRETFWTHENSGAQQKINQIGELLNYLLLIPKFKTALKKAHEGIDFNKVRFDDNDRFHFSFWKGYDYEGKNFEERFAPYEELYKTIPFKKRNPQATANFMTGD